MFVGALTIGIGCWGFRVSGLGFRVTIRIGFWWVPLILKPVLFVFFWEGGGVLNILI